MRKLMMLKQNYSYEQPICDYSHSGTINHVQNSSTDSEENSWHLLYMCKNKIALSVSYLKNAINYSMLNNSLYQGQKVLAPIPVRVKQQ